MNKERLSKIFNQIMVEIYQASIPSADWYELVEKYRDPESGISYIPYWDYTISGELLEMIVDKYLKKYHVNVTDSETLRFQILLGPSPESLKTVGSSKNPPNP